MTELLRARCPECSSVWDVWIDDDGAVEEGSKVHCPDCMLVRRRVRGVVDGESTALWGNSFLEESE